MVTVDIVRMQRQIREQDGCCSQYHGTVPAPLEAVRAGLPELIHVFKIDHPAADFVYLWPHGGGDRHWPYASVLHLPGIAGPEDAARQVAALRAA